VGAEVVVATTVDIEECHSVPGPLLVTHRPAAKVTTPPLRTDRERGGPPGA